MTSAQLLADMMQQSKCEQAEGCKTPACVQICMTCSVEALGLLALESVQDQHLLVASLQGLAMPMYHYDHGFEPLMQLKALLGFRSEPFQPTDGLTGGPQIPRCCCAFCE